MAQKPIRPCAHQGCSALTRETWCDKHKPKRSDVRTQDAVSWRKLYKLDLWTKQLRPEQLLREPFCRECARWGFRVPATDVDHIVLHKGDMARFSDPANLQSLCHACHARKTAAEKRDFAPQKSSK